MIFRNEKLIFLLILLIYLLFPTKNSVLDAYYYGASIKYGVDLFSPHHLLYNVFLYVLNYPIKEFLTDILLFSKVINSVFSVASLYIFYKILILLNIIKKEAILYTLFVAFSFGVWRYSTENETYILPIFFSLLGSFYFLKYNIKVNLKHIFLSGFFAALACLFHQIHFFWWLGLLIGFWFNKKQIKTVIFYSIPALFVPVAYVLVLIFYNKSEPSFSNMVQYIFYDFYTGSASAQFGIDNFILTFASSIRTFVQVHLNIFILLKKSMLYLLPILLMLFLIIKIGTALYKRNCFKSQDETTFRHFSRTHLLIFIFQFSVAFYAVGNVEFMVMFPFLLILGIISYYKINYKLLKITVLILFVWNFTFGIYPNNNFNYYNDDKLVDYIINNQNSIFIVKNDNILNRLYYKTGVDNYKNVILHSKIKNKNQVQKLIENNIEIYTDVINKPEIFGRAKIVTKPSSIDFHEFKKDSIFSFTGLYGTSIVYRLTK